jgi:hypothetical protein
MNKYINATQQQPLQQGARAAAFGLAAPQPLGFPWSARMSWKSQCADGSLRTISDSLPGGAKRTQLRYGA